MAFRAAPSLLELRELRAALNQMAAHARRQRPVGLFLQPVGQARFHVVAVGVGWAAREVRIPQRPELFHAQAGQRRHLRAFEDRVAALNGKAMMVCMSRRICVALYDEIIKLRPDWHSNDDNAGSIEIVMTGAASDPVAWQQHIGNKARRDLAGQACPRSRRTHCDW